MTTISKYILHTTMTLQTQLQQCTHDYNTSKYILDTTTTL